MSLNELLKVRREAILGVTVRHRAQNLGRSGDIEQTQPEPAKARETTLLTAFRTTSSQATAAD